MLHIRLWWAAHAGDAGLVRQYLTDGDDIEQIGGYHEDSTPINIACVMGNYACVSVLLEFGAGILHIDHNGCTPLHNLVAHEQKPNLEGSYTGENQKELVRLMLYHGADPRIHDADGHTVMSHAVENNLCGVASILLDHGVDPSGVVNTKKTGDTALHVAIDVMDYWKVNISMVELLISMGASVSKGQNEGQTALTYAAQYAEIRKGPHVVLRALLTM